MDHTPPSPPHPSLLALAAAWPGAVADPSAAAAYERALAGLDAASVEAAVASLSRDGRPAPAPGLLRTVVLARAAAPRAAVPVPSAPGIGAVAGGPGWRARGVPEEGRRAWRLLWISGVLCILGALMHSAPWLIVRRPDGAEVSIAPADADPRSGAWAIVLALVAVVLGRTYLRRERPARHVRGAFYLSGLVGCLGALAAAITVPAILDLQDEAAGRPGVSVAFGAGLWAALAFNAAALVAAAWGAVVLSYGPGAWRGSDAYRPPRWHRWATVAVGAVCVGLVALLVSSIVADTPSDRATNSEVAALGAAKGDARRAEAGNAYLRVAGETNRRMSAAYASLERALSSGDTTGIVRSVRTHIAIATTARRRLLRTVRAPADAQPAVDRMAVALGRQVEAYRSLATQLERYGTVNDTAVAAVDAAENATADAAARLEAALGVSSNPL